MVEQQLKDLQYIINAGPSAIVEKYFKLLQYIDLMTSMAKMTNHDITKVTGLSESQLFRRKNKPELWIKDELLKLFSAMELKVGQSTSFTTPPPSTRRDDVRELGDTIIRFGRLPLSDQLKLRQTLDALPPSTTIDELRQLNQKVVSKESAIQAYKELNARVTKDLRNSQSNDLGR